MAFALLLVRFERAAQDFYVSFFAQFVQVTAPPEPSLVWQRYVTDEKPIQVGQHVTINHDVTVQEAIDGVVTEIKPGRVIMPGAGAAQPSNVPVYTQQGVEVRPPAPSADGGSGLGGGGGGGLVRERSSPRFDSPRGEIERTIAVTVQADLVAMGYELEDEYILACVKAHDADYGRCLEAIFDGWESSPRPLPNSGDLGSGTSGAGYTPSWDRASSEVGSYVARVCFTSPPQPRRGRGAARRFAWYNLEDCQPSLSHPFGPAGSSGSGDSVVVGTEYYFKPAAEHDNDVSWTVPQGLPKQGFADGEDIPLFVHSAVDDYTFKINPASRYIKGYESLFVLCGIMLAKALVDNVQLHSLHFTSAFYKALLHLPFDMKDLESLDGDLYRTIQQVMSMAPEEVEYLYLCFAIGDTELEPGGMERDVTGENRSEWASKVLDHFNGQVSEQRRCIATGFSKVLPLRELKGLGIDHNQLELFLSGLPHYDVEDWRKNTEYPACGNLTPRIRRMHQQNIENFWSLMAELTDTEKAGVVRFSTGSAGVPLEGFAALRGRQARNEASAEKFKIQRVNPPPTGTCSAETCGRANVCVCRLPQSHTCFNTLDLPPYPTKEVLREKLMTAVAGSAGFGFA